MASTFQQLGISSVLADQCKKIGLLTPTPIQKNCIPKILEGFDCIGCSETGTGKTLAFLLPILHTFCQEPYGIFALIVSPTRELCYQINEQISVLSTGLNVRSCVVTGGMSMIHQAQELQKKPHIVVATPGRLADHLESCNTFSFKKIKFLVLDEADRLFDGRFNGQMQVIFNAIPKNKQNLLFSATLTSTLEQIREIACKNVFLWQSDTPTNIVEGLQQFYTFCPNSARNGYFVEIIRSFLSDNPESSIIAFTDTCKNCQVLSATLKEIGFDNVTLNALLSQKERLQMLHAFKSERIKILIATDVASRGLDIPTVSLVINHTISNNVTDYIHRIGRTARANQKGMAISLVSPHDIVLVRSIEQSTNTKLKEYKVSGKDVAKILNQVNVTEREVRIKLEENEQDDSKPGGKRKKHFSDDSGDFKNRDRKKFRHRIEKKKE